MTLTLGPITGMRDHSTFNLVDDQLSFGGWIFGSTLVEAEALQVSLSSMRSYQPVVEIVSSIDPYMTGYYRNLKVTPSPAVGAFERNYAFQYQATATRIRDPQAPLITSRINGAARTGVPGGVTPIYWHAVPSTRKVYDCSGTTTKKQRTGPGGTVDWFGSSTFAPKTVTYMIDPADFRTMGPSFTVNSQATLSDAVQAIGNAALWQAQNGLVKVTGSASASYTMRVYFPDATTPSGWGATPYDVQIGAYLAGSFVVLNVSYVQLVRLDVEAVTWRLIGNLTTGGGTADSYRISVDLTLRRGSFTVDLVTSSTSNMQFGIKDNAAVGYTALPNNEGAYRTANDSNGTAGAGNRLVMMSGKTLTLTSLASGFIFVTSATTWADWGLGCEHKGSSAASPNVRTDIRDQYFANHGATVEFG